jgi:DNA helicase HerA-like ATPase
MIQPFLVAQSDHPILFNPRMANRHGLIAGATGTGKTVTLAMLAENFSALGIPVFLADVKGDLSGLALRPDTLNAKVAERARKLGLDNFAPLAFPVTFWDVYGENGHPVRATISEMGPLLLSRLLSLNETQEGVLGMLFRIADDNGLLLLDLKDLRAMARFVGENASSFTQQYGNVSSASVGAIQRNLLTLEEQGADKFFGEPAMNLDDFLQTAADGRGMINILSAERLLQNPRAYAALLLWLLSELFERLPEVGDVDKPKLVFFFDEAHLLFNDIPRALQEKIEQVVRLIRSKGVGVFFVTQNPLDLPQEVAGQLGNRVQHALRAFTPRDQKAVKAAAETFRQNPRLDVETALTQLAVGEALVSLLDESGQPEVVERALIVPPHSQIGAIPPADRQRIIQSSILYGTYEKAVDRESASEILAKRAAEKVAASNAPGPAPATSGLGSVLWGSTGPRGGKHDGLVETMAKSAVRTMGSSVGREIIRGVLGSLFGGGGRRR